VRAASKRAPRESAEDKVLRLPALRLPSPDAGLFDIRICVPRDARKDGVCLRHRRGNVIARRRKAPKQSRRFDRRAGLLRGACHRAAQSADPLARNDELCDPRNDGRGEFA
jgi:hypothetical protein